MKQLLYVRESAVKFIKTHKMANSHFIPSDQALSHLGRKLEKDVDVIGPIKYEVEDITQMMKKIIENEEEINNSITFLKNKQNELCEYLVNYNNSVE
jgi:hypothetical protein